VSNYTGKDLISHRKVVSILYLVLINYGILIGTINLGIIILRFTPLLTLILGPFSGIILEIVTVWLLISFVR
jgi:hypothetical protein